MRASCFGRQLDLSSLRQLVAKFGEIQRPLGVFADGPLLRSCFEARELRSPPKKVLLAAEFELGVAVAALPGAVIFGARVCA